jgi:hypothetical protein
LGLILSLITTSAIGVDRYQQLPTTEEINSAINRQGAAVVLRGLWDQDSTAVFDQLIAKIEAGDVNWIRLAARLRKASDAGSSEMLDGAMSNAIRNAPVEVLLVTDLGGDLGGFSIASICSGRFNLMDEDSPKKITTWYTEAERALMKLRPSSVAEKQSACLVELRRSRKHWLDKKKAEK